MAFIVSPFTRTIIIVFQWVLLAGFILLYMLVQTWCQMIHSSVRIALSMESLWLRRMKVRQPPVVHRSCCFAFLLVSVCVCLCVCVSQQLWPWVGLADVMASLHEAHGHHPDSLSLSPSPAPRPAPQCVIFRYCLDKHESPLLVDSRRAEPWHC